MIDGTCNSDGGDVWNFQVKWSIEVPSPVPVHCDIKSAKDLAYNPIILLILNKPNTLTLSMTELVNLFWMKQLFSLMSNQKIILLTFLLRQPPPLFLVSCACGNFKYM